MSGRVITEAVARSASRDQKQSAERMPNQSQEQLA